MSVATCYATYELHHQPNLNARISTAVPQTSHHQKDYSRPLHVDCSVEYELPSQAKPPPGSRNEPLLMIHPCYFRKMESQRRSPFINNLPGRSANTAAPSRKTTTSTRTINQNNSLQQQRNLNYLSSSTLQQQRNLVQQQTVRQNTNSLQYPQYQQQLTNNSNVRQHDLPTSNSNIRPQMSTMSNLNVRQLNASNTVRQQMSNNVNSNIRQQQGLPNANTRQQASNCSQINMRQSQPLSTNSNIRQTLPANSNLRQHVPDVNHSTARQQQNLAQQQIELSNTNLWTTADQQLNHDLSVGKMEPNQQTFSYHSNLPTDNSLWSNSSPLAAETASQNNSTSNPLSHNPTVLENNKCNSNVITGKYRQYLRTHRLHPYMSMAATAFPQLAHQMQQISCYNV